MMSEHPVGDVWIGDTGGHTVSPIISRHRSEACSKVSGEPFSVLFDRDGSLWIGPDQIGLRRLIHVRQLESPPLDQLRAREGLSSDQVYSALEDREGNLWFGTPLELDRFPENKVIAYSSRDRFTPHHYLPAP